MKSKRRIKREKRKKKAYIVSVLLFCVLIVFMGERISLSRKIKVINANEVKNIDVANEKSKTIKLDSSDKINEALMEEGISKSKNIVIVKNDRLEKIIAASFASYNDANLITIKDNKVNDDTINKVTQLNPSRVDVLFSTEGIDVDGIKKLKGVCKNVNVIKGKDIYELSKKIEKNMKNSENIFVINQNNDKENILITSAACKLNAPILVSQNNDKIVNILKKYKNIYFIGNVQCDDVKNLKIHRFNNKDIYKFNEEINNEFMNDFSDVILSRNVDDNFINMGLLKQPLILIKDKPTNKQELYLKSKKIRNIYLTKDISRESLEYVLNIKNNLENGEIKFNKPKAAFFFSHEDDVVLFAHSVIVNAINELGPENIKVVLINKGDGSGVYRDIKKGSFKNIPSTMTLDEFVQARKNEFNEEMKVYGVPNENIKCLDIDDWKTKNNADKIKKVIRCMENYRNEYDFFTFSYFNEPERDHETLGNIFRDMYDNQEIDNVYFINKPKAYELISKDLKIQINLKTQEDKDKVNNARMCYIKHDTNKGLYGIGNYSVNTMFQELYLNIKNGGYIYGSIPGQKDDN